MRMKALIIALALLPMPLAAEPLQPTKDDIKDAASSDPYAPYPEGEMAALQRDVRGALKRGSTDAAVDVATTKYGFPAAPSRRLVRAWVIAQARHYVPDKSWIAGTRAELLDVVPAFRGKPLALAFIGEALDATGDDCRADDFAALMQGSPDPAGDAYAIAAAATCTGNFARAAVAAGDRAMPALIRSAEYGGLPPRDTIPLYVWLTRPSTLAHVREADRPVVAAMLWQRYLKELFKADRKDYSCLRSHQLMIVYGQQDIEAIQAFTPDFHALEIPRIVFNRAHDRGFVRWSTGWSGGTYRLRFVNGKWQFDSISSWIS